MSLLTNLAGQLKGSSNPYQMLYIKAGVGAFALLFVLLGYWFIIAPNLETQAVQIEEMKDSEVRGNQLSGEIAELTSTIQDLEKTNEASMVSLFTGQEIQRFNLNFTDEAKKGKLKLLKLEVSVPTSIESNDQGQANTDEASQISKSFSKVSLNYELTGNYMNYLGLRAYLAELGKIINVEKEEIKITGSAGEIRATGMLRLTRKPDSAPSS